MSELIHLKEHFDIRKMDIRSEVEAGKRYKGRLVDLHSFRTLPSLNSKTVLKKLGTRV